jgi:hypothetical protein
MEYRNLLTSVLNCLKNVLFTTMAFHTNRGLPVPVSDAGVRGMLCCVCSSAPENWVCGESSARCVYPPRPAPASPSLCR